MAEDYLYIVVIVALLPLTASMLVTQVNPYHALVIRGILGAVAALVYVLFGAADVALTEALVGTMLSITLYAVAVRSSLSMRLGVLEGMLPPKLKPAPTPEQAHPSEQMLSALRQPLSHYHMRLELITYSSPQALQSALMAKEVHAICIEPPPMLTLDSQAPYHIQTRIQRLYQIIQSELPATLASLAYVKPDDLDQPNRNQSGNGMPDPVEVQS